MVLDELSQAIPDLRKAMIMRHPFAVAASKTRYKNHHWPTLPSYFLSKDEAVKSRLGPQSKFIEEIEKREDPLLNFITVWCILHKLAFCSSSIRDFYIVFYEELSFEPSQIVPELFGALGLTTYFERHKSVIDALFEKPSRVTMADNTIHASRQGKASWMTSLTPDTIDRGLDILRVFGLDHIYGNDHFPKLGAGDLRAQLSG